MIAVFKHLNDYHMEGLKLFTVAPKVRIRTTGWKLQEDRLPFNARMNVSILRSFPKMNELSWDMVNSLPREELN